MIPTVIDQVDKGEERIIESLSGKENFTKLVSLFLKQVQEIEVQNHTIAGQKDIDVAEGVWLDYIGAIVGLERQGLSDEDYRLAIRTKIGINTADGTPNVIIDLIKQHAAATDVKLVNYYPAGFSVSNNGTRGQDHTLYNLVQGIKPAGTAVDVIHNEGGVCFVPAWLNSNAETTVDADFLLDNGDFLLLDDGVDEEDFLVILRSPDDVYQNDITYSYLDWVGASSFEIVSGGVVQDLDLSTGGILEITTSGSGGSDAGKLAQVIIKDTVSVN